MYLSHAHYIPEDRLSQLMSDLFDIPVCAATLAATLAAMVAAMVGRTADRLEVLARHVQDLIAGTTPVKHLDETGVRVAGKTWWLHVACTPRLSAFRVDPRRGEMLPGLSGRIVHDHWKPYFKIDDIEHCLCNAHHLRELQAVFEIDGEPWAGSMQRLLLRANRARNLARQTGKPLRPSTLEWIQRRYNPILDKAIAFHDAQPPLPRARRGPRKRRVGHNLALRLQQHRASTLRFFTDPEIPFSNNEAERDIRMAKLRQKISGGFRSPKGATDFAILRTVITTARKQRWNIIESLRTPTHQLIQKMTI